VVVTTHCAADFFNAAHADLLGKMRLVTFLIWYQNLLQNIFLQLLQPLVKNS